MGIGLADAVGDGLHHDLVGAEVAARHDVLDLEPDRGLRLDRGAQHVAGRKLDDPVFVDEPLRLGALARPRRTQEYQSHWR